jgi:pimeloyl-ACP methyl ester carboxylesterase
VAADLASVAECFADPSLPTVWICHSYGSTVLLKMLEKNPQHIPAAGFIFLSTAVRSDKLPLADGGHPLMKLPVFLLKCLQKTMTNAFANMAVHPSREDVQEMVRQGGNDNDMAAAKCCHRNMEWATLNDLNGPIKEQPALVLHGVDDGIIPLECGQHLANQLPQSKFVALEKTSHLIMLELPEAVSNEILVFLESFLSEEVTL